MSREFTAAKNRVTEQFWDLLYDETHTEFRVSKAFEETPRTELMRHWRLVWREGAEHIPEHVRAFFEAIEGIPEPRGAKETEALFWLVTCAMARAGILAMRGDPSSVRQ